MSDIEKLLQETADEEYEEEQFAKAHVNVKSVLRDAAEEVDRDDYLTKKEANAAKDTIKDEDNYEDDTYDDRDEDQDSVINKPTKKAYDSSSEEDDDAANTSSDLDIQIQICCYRGNADGLDKLLSKAKDPSLVFHKDRHGWTPLHWAASKGKKALVEIIVDYAKKKSKQLVNTPDGIIGWTALHLACIGGHLECIAYLLEKGADATAKSKMQESPADCLSAKLSKKDKMFAMDLLGERAEEPGADKE